MSLIAGKRLGTAPPWGMAWMSVDVTERLAPFPISSISTFLTILCKELSFRIVAFMRKR